MRDARSAWKIIAIVIALAILPACGGADSVPPAASFSTATGTGNLTKSNSLWVVNLEGDYTDMGRQYGALLKSQLQALHRDIDAAVPASATRDGTVRALMALRDPREKDFMRGVAEQTGLSDEQLELVNASLFFIYNTGCSVFGATGTQTTSGTTIAGRNFDNPRATFAPILSGRSALVIYNPRNRTTGSGATLHADNAVAAMTQI
ncbi:MAG TPA: hypothetical protein VNT02_02340, partial [Burkholderiales bacterium]|nr:hypothetical protein [Burkholderiales bacterium]